MQGEVTRDSEGRGSQSEGEFGMGINEEKVHKLRRLRQPALNLVFLFFAEKSVSRKKKVK